MYVENINFNYCGRSYYCTFGVSSQIDEWATTQLIVVENYSVVNIYNATGLMNAEFGNDDYRVYSLCDDIDMQGRQWRPKSLKGIFFGNGHKISNIELTSENMSSSMSNIGGAHSTGLFWLAKDSIIDSLIVENITINIQQMLIGVKVYAAGLLAQTAGLVVVNNCIVTGEIKVVGDVDIDVAGIVARAEDGRCFVFNSENKANIIVSTKGVAFVGGIVSRVFSEIFEANSCKNSGEIQVIDIFKQSNEEEIPVHAKFYVGGIVGSFGNLTYIYKQEHSLINCTNTEQISLTNIKIYQGCLFVGGVLGYRDVNLDTLQEVSIKDCENSGEIVEDVNNQYLEDTLVSINNIVGYNNNDNI